MPTINPSEKIFLNFSIRTTPLKNGLYCGSVYLSVTRLPVMLQQTDAAAFWAAGAWFLT
jgi:hypothetical protein